MFVAHKTFGRFCMATTLWFVVFFCLTFVSFLALRLQSCSFHFDHSDLYICIWAHNSQAGKCTYTYFCNHLFSVLQRCWTWYLYHSDNFVLNWSSCFAGQLQLPPPVARYFVYFFHPLYFSMYQSVIMTWTNMVVS